jgi:hypothetical protein
VLFVLTAAMKDLNPIAQYTFSRERDSDGVLLPDSRDDPFVWFVYAVYGIWVITIALEMATYLVGRGGGGKLPYAEQCSAMPFILFNRVALPGKDYRCATALVLMLWYVGFGVAAVTMMHTVIAHSYVKRNAWMGWLLIALTGCQVLAGLSDALSLGSSTGLAVQNRIASYFAALRCVVFLPFLLIFSLFFVWLCNPPWN